MYININIRIESIAHRRSMRFHLRNILQSKKNSKSSIGLQFSIEEFTVRPQIFFWIFMFHIIFLECLIQIWKAFKKLKIELVKKLIRNINKLKTGV